MNELDIDQEKESWIIHYLHRDISFGELKALNQWLQESPENRETFFQLKGIHDTISNHKVLSSEEIEKSWQKMELKIASSTKIYPRMIPEQNVFVRSLKYISIIAAASILGFVVSWYSMLQFGSPSSPALTEELSYHTFNVPKGGKPCSISLADGTTIQLNVAGTLRYPANFSSTHREVYLDGEAWFDVSEDAGNPFTIHLQHQTIAVYGTSFNVEAYKDETKHNVTLVNGSISLETHGNKGQFISKIMLKPGEKACFDIESGTVAIEKVDSFIADTWIRKEYKFKDETLDCIVKRLEKYYDIDFRLDDTLKNIRYTGTISFDQNIEKVLNLINYDKRFIFKQSGNTIQIAKK